MSSDEKEIVVILDAKRLLVLGVILVLVVASMYSYINALFAFIAPSEEFPLEVSVATYDTNDVLKTSFVRGDTVRVKATVEKAMGYYYNSYTYYYPYAYYATTFKVIIAILDADGRPAYFDDESETIGWPGGSQVTVFNVPISSDAATGTFTIKVMAWTDWLPTGVALAPDAGEASITVS